MNEDFDQVDQEDPIPLPKGFTPIKKSGSEIPLPKGFEPVKKKVSIADVGMAAKGGWVVGVSKAQSEELKPETPQQKLSRLGINVSFDKKPVTEYGGAEPVTDFLNKLSKEPEYIDLSNSYDVGKLSGMIDAKVASSRPKTAAFVSEEMLKRAKPDYSKKVEDKDDLMASISDVAVQNAYNKVSSSKNLTDVTRDDLIQVGLEYTKQVSPSQWNRNVSILNEGGDLGDENKYNLEKVGAAILLNKNDDQSASEHLQRLSQETEAAHPKFALAKAWEIVGAYNHEKDNKATGGWWRTRPSLLQVEAWLNEPELKSRFSGNEVGYDILKEQLSKLKPEQKVFKAEDVPISGGINRFEQSILSGVEDIGNIFRSDAERQISNLNPTIGRGTLSGNYRLPGEASPFVQRLNQLEDKQKDVALTEEEKLEYETLKKNSKIRSGWDKFKDQTSDVLGQVVLQALLTKGAGGVGKILTSAKTPMLLNSGISTALISYDQTRKDAVYNFPTDEVKQNIFTGAMTAANIFSERIFKDEKVFNAFRKGLEVDLVTTLKNLSAENISKQQIKNLVVDNAIKYGGSFVEETHKNAFEEAVVQASDEFLSATMNASDYDQSKALRNIADTYVTTLYSMGGVASLAAIKNKSRANELNSVVLYGAAQNPEKSLQYIKRLYETGEITKEDLIEKLEILNRASDIVLNEPERVSVKPTKQRSEYFIQTLNAELKREQLEAKKDKNEAAELKAQVEESEKKASDIYNELTPEQQLIKKAIDSGEISEDNMYLSDALTNPETANSLLETIASQAQGEVAPEFGDAKEAMVRQFGKTLVNEAIAKYPKLEKQNQDIVGEPEQISQPIELSIEIPESEKGFPKVEYEDAVETTNVDILEQKNKLTEQKDAEVKEAERANQQSQQQATKESKPIIESEKNSNGAGKEPPKPPVENKMDESSGESNLDYMANNVPETGEVEAYLSGDTIKKHTKESPENNQERGVMELRQSLEHGIETIKEAKRVFGEDYVEKTLDYIDKSKMGVSNKALMYVSLENELGKEKITNPEKAQEISKLQSLVYEKSQAFARENSKALNYQRLRKFAQAGYDISKVTDNFFSTEELVARRTLNKAVEANADVINEAYAAQETGALTPEVEKLINEGIAKEVERLYEQLPKEKKSIAEKAIKALEAVQAKIRSRTYDAGLGVPVAFVDAGITVIKLAIKAGVKIADAIEMGIAKIKEKLGDKKWYKEDEFRKYLQDVFKPVEEIAQKTKPVKDIVKEALIEKGFGREINVKGEKRNILDWKKLAGAAGSISNIRKNVNEVLQQKGWAGLSDTQKGVIKEDFIKEYVALRESVISKAQTELAKRNKETVTPEQKTAAKKLAELYTFGIFDGNFDEYENALNKALGAKVSEQGFNDAKKIARALENIYKSTFKGVLLNDVSAKSAIEKLEDQIRILLFREAKAQGNFNLKAANIVRTYFETSQTMLLNNMKQAFENPLSGLSQNAIDAIEGIQAGTSNKELRSQRREAMKNIYKDMVINGGITYGKIESQFVNRQHLDDLVNRMSDNKIYHGIMSTVTGKATLNAMDAMFKLAITEKKFATNLIKILTHKSNPKAMSKEDALKFVTEKLTGQTYKDAQVTAKKVIEEINKNAGVELIKPEQTQIDRFANDIVKASLEMGGKITTEQITAAYNAAYKAAGLGLGHEANNPLSGMIKGYSAKLEGDINRALKDKEWNRAAMLIYKSVLFRNILNPFVGGGTNWLVLKLEKAGLGLATGLIYKFGSKSQLDLSSELGQKQLEARLYNHARYKDNFMRGLVGGIVSTSGYLLYRGLSDEDEEKYRKMRKENPWAARYLDVVTPEVTLAEMGIKDNKFKQYIEKSYNRGDAFDPVTKVIKGVDYAIKGEKGKMWGAFGEAVGTKTNAPLPWRLFKDGQVLYQGITGQDPYHGNYKPSDGFLSGVTQGGVLEWLGVPRSVSESQGNTINLKYKNKKDEYINRDATIEENKKYEDEKVKETNRMLSEYEKGKKVTINRYGEVSLKSDSKGKEVDYNKLTETQQKELLSAIKESAGDYSKSKLLDEIK